MATTTPTPAREGMTPGPETPGLPQKHGRFATHRAAVSWAAVLAALVAAAAFAVVTLTGGDDTGPVTADHSGLIEHGSIRAHEGSVEDNAAHPAASSGHAGLAEHGSIRAHEGSVEDNAAHPAASSGHAGLAEHGSIRAHEGSVEDGSSC